MTTVTATLTGPNNTPARGYLRFTPTNATGVEGLNLPLAHTKRLENGSLTVELEPTTAGWAWAVTFQILGVPHWTRYYLVPASGTFSIDSLTEVDPQTLTPTSEPEPSWYAYVDQLISNQVGKVAVVTGNEIRPNFGSVLWVGGTIQPVNMAENTDIWFKANA